MMYVVGVYCRDFFWVSVKRARGKTWKNMEKMRHVSRHITSHNTPRTIYMVRARGYCRFRKLGVLYKIRFSSLRRYT